MLAAVPAASACNKASSSTTTEKPGGDGNQEL